MFVHGLWLLPTSWDRWAKVFEARGSPHYDEVIPGLKKKPAVVGHSFGGLMTVLPLPISALRSGSPVLRNPGNRNRAVPLTFEQFQYAFANAVSEDEAKQLYDTFCVPAPGEPLFQAAAANLNPWTEDKVDTKNPSVGRC